MTNELTNRIVSLTLDLPSTSEEDAVRQFISAIGLYGMGAFDFQVYNAEDDVVMVNGREAMQATMDERQEVKEDEIRSEVMEDAAIEEDEADWPEGEEE